MCRLSASRAVLRKPVREAYYTGLPGEMGRMLSIAGWGWHSETALHTLRLIVSGLFDKVPGPCS